jgi:hypothetical protein
MKTAEIQYHNWQFWQKSEIELNDFVVKIFVCKKYTDKKCSDRKREKNESKESSEMQINYSVIAVADLFFLTMQTTVMLSKKIKL